MNWIFCIAGLAALLSAFAGGLYIGLKYPAWVEQEELLDDELI
jgi:hypothetical protein